MDSPDPELTLEEPDHWRVFDAGFEEFFGTLAREIRHHLIYRSLKQSPSEPSEYSIVCHPMLRECLKRRLSSAEASRYERDSNQ